MLAGAHILVVDNSPRQLLFLIGAEQRRFVDLAQIKLQAGLNGGGKLRANMTAPLRSINIFAR